MMQNKTLFKTNRVSTFFRVLLCITLVLFLALGNYDFAGFAKTNTDIAEPTVLNLKKNDFDDYENLTLHPGGMPFGVKFQTKGVLVVGVSDVICKEGKVSPCAEAGIKEKDIILKINGREVNTVEEVTDEIAKSDGKPITILILRNKKEINVTLIPRKSQADGVYRAGLWVRDSTAGIGTVTFINPVNNSFAGLGHGICDADTGMLMPLRKGEISHVTICGVIRGASGAPGELKGYFSNESCGELLGNSESGVYGLFTEAPKNLSEPMKVAKAKEVKTGKAYILCTTDSSNVEKYEIEITKINSMTQNTKNFIIKVTDEKLLSKTGGIVQGMSGSPIIQNGKIVGAVTHVMVNDPKSGYGIYIGNMLKNMPELLQQE